MDNLAQHRQIMGTETEWDIGVRKEGETNFEALSAGNHSLYNASTVNEELPKGIVRTRNGFLSNGARFYMDINTHPEYATPESISMKDLLASERAGERILAHGLHRLLIQNERVAEVVAMKRVVDDFGQSIGYHLNVSEDRRYIKDLHQLHPLAWHYATSLPMLGSGVIERYTEHDEYNDSTTKYRYSWGQKVLRVTHDFSSSTTDYSKPFINSRDESHAVSEHYRRIHIVGNDNHVLEWPAWMLFGTTSLIIAACRQGRMRQFVSDTNSSSPATALARIARYDLEDSQKYGLIVGGQTKYYTANEINMMILEDAGKVSGKTDEQMVAYREWVRAVEDRERDVMSLNLRSDSVTKLAAIRRKQEKRQNTSGEFEIEDLVVDQQYMTIFRATREQALEMTHDQIYDNSPVAKIRRRITSPAVGLSDDLVMKRVHEPPHLTRAKIRGYFIKKMDLLNLKSVDWKDCTVTEITEGGNETEISFRFDPHDGTSDR